MSDEQTPAETEPATEAPATPDPYFMKKDGTPVTGGAPAKGEAPPETPPPAAAKPKPAEPKQSIGDAWREVKAERKAQKEARAELEVLKVQMQQQIDAAAQRDERIKKDFRGYVKEQGLSLRDLLEADLKESDVDPKERKVQTLESELTQLKSMLQQLVEKDQRQAQQATAQSEMKLIEDKAAEYAEEFPRLARNASKLAQNIHSDFYALSNAGQGKSLVQLFQDYETYLESIGVPLTVTAAANGGRSQQSVRPSRVKGAPPAKHVVEEPDDDGDGADDGTAPAITNRNAGERHTNGRFMSREERVRMASAKIQFRN